MPQAANPDNTYPDSHPELKDALATITTATSTVRYVTREAWERVAAERDEYRRVLALISAWRVQGRIHSEHLDRLLARVGETRRNRHGGG